MRRDQQVVGADGQPTALHGVTNGHVVSIGVCCKRQDLNRPENRFDLFLEPGRTAARSAVAQFAGDDDAGADLGFANPGYALCNAALGVAHQPGKYVGVEQVTGGHLTARPVPGRAKPWLESLPPAAEESRGRRAARAAPPVR